MRIGIGANRRIIVGKKKDADKSEIDIRIIGTARSLSTVGSKHIKLPTVRDCPECNGYDWYDRPNRQYQNDDRRFNGPIRGRASVHDRLGDRLSVHDRLGDRVGYFPRNQEELEEMADARVLDEFIFCRDANTYRMESRGNRHQSVRQPQLPPWCLEGLTRTQKRRL